MKHLFLILLVILCAGLTFYVEQHDSSLLTTGKSKVSDGPYYSGILKDEYQNVKAVANYDIKAELFPERKLAVVDEYLTWINKTEFPANEIQIHLYPNAFRNRRTLFISGRGGTLPDGSTSGIYFKEVSFEDKKPAQIKIIQPEVSDAFDSTAASIALNKTIMPGDSIKIHFKYSLPIPKMMKRFGYAAGRNFFFISQWFPKAGVFSNGKWICSQYHPYTNFFSDFGKYSAKIIVPKGYQVAATGVMKDSSLSESKIIYNFEQYGVHDFAWMATDNIENARSIYKRKDGSDILINAFVQPEHVKYKSRFINAVKNSLKFFEDYIGIYPYQTISIVDVPKTSLSGGMEYPTLITVGAELFSPVSTLQPESVTIHEFTHQFFYGLLANNEVYETWLDEGITSYITDKIAYRYYGKPEVNFKLFGYYPVFGINFLSYNELPLVYTLGDYKIDEGANSLSLYYQSPVCASISDTSYKLPDALSYTITGYSKPELMLLSLERNLGFNNLMYIFRKYYQSYKFSHPSAEDFIHTVNENSKEDMSWFFKSLYRNSSAFDYSIRYVRPVPEEPGSYEVYAERLRDGVFKLDVALYTDKDTLLQTWNGEERWKRFIFHTKNTVLGAEIDPFRKNIMDLNYANNSYIIKDQYAGSTSIMLRWLFWIQNLVLLLGSVA
ncbi:MAG: M1 family metallopeptidase [Bacteroidota bacterium]|nr:M1 family metallopeptidase [Bacteroidota bacterium]MDP4196328.1 M1 family metallopeptidase [Bacteroidota bacterium]